MKLNELLKVNSVRCIKTKVDEDLVEGEIYKVEGFNDETIKIVDSNGFSSWHNKNLFEPVINNDMSKPNSEIDISLNSVGVDLTKQQANDFCEKLTNDSEEYAYDWHYFEDVVVIKRLKKSLLDCQEG